ncbi:MAG TPA: hypothetical protein VGK54_13135, partial [Chloroflexota bacterium]
LVIANCCYHVGHERSTKVADDRGFLKEEGLTNYVIERGGLLPADFEHLALGRVMWERGIDIATAVDVRAAVIQNSVGEDVYIVGGWRTGTQSNGKLITAKHITRPDQLRGAKTPMREKGNLSYHSLAGALRKMGIDPESDIEWIERRHTAYANEDEGELLRTGQVSLLSVDGPDADRLIQEGYPVLYDMDDYYKGLGHWPPGKVIVATKQTIEKRTEELTAFLRGNLHAYWFIQDPANHAYMYELETRMRAATSNETERKVRMLRTEAPRTPRKGTLMAGHMVMDGLVPRVALQTIIDDLVQYGGLDEPIDIDRVMEDGPSVAAYESLLGRGVIKRDFLNQWLSVMA